MGITEESRIISHTMKIWERIIDRRLMEQTRIGEEQFGFMPGRGQSLAMECQTKVALKGMKHGKAIGPGGITVEVWKSLGEEGVDDYVAGSAPEYFRAGEIGMEGQCDCANIKREGGIQDCGNYRDIKNDITYHEDLGKNNRQQTEGGDTHRRRAVRFHAGVTGQE